MWHKEGTFNMNASNMIIQKDELWCNRNGHDKVYKLAIIRRESQYEVWSFYKARKAPKWNSHCHFTGTYEHSANMAYVQQLKSKLNKGYEDCVGSTICFPDAEQMLDIIGIKISKEKADGVSYECVDDFAEKRGFVIGFEYEAEAVDEENGIITLRNDAGESHELPLSYFKKVV